MVGVNKNDPLIAKYNLKTFSYENKDYVIYKRDIFDFQ